MLIDVCIKFHEYSLSGFQVIEWTQFVTDRRTDKQTDARGKTICLPTLKGGDIIIQYYDTTQHFASGEARISVLSFFSQVLYQ